MDVMDGSVKKKNGKMGYYVGWKKVSGIWVISWIIVCLCIFRHMISEGLEHRKQTLASLCDERSRMLQHKFTLSLISIFLHSNNPSATDHETSRPLAYAARVLQEEFDKEQGWSMINTIEEDDLKPSQYAPVIFTQDTISVDVLPRKEDRGKGVLTAPFPLLKTGRLGATDGYLGGVFDVESLMEKLLQQLASEQKILVNVYDTTNLSNPISMYGSDVSGNDLEHVSHLNFGDPFRSHEMRCRFKQKPPWPRLAITTAAGILVIAFLIGHIFHATVSRIAKLEDDYQKMMMLKKQAEAADVAKSQITTPVNGVLDTHLDVTQQDYVRTPQVGWFRRVLSNPTMGAEENHKFLAGRLCPRPDGEHKSALQNLPPHQPYPSFGSYGGAYMGRPPYGSSVFNGSRIPPYDVPFSGGSAYPYNYGRGLPGGGSPYRPVPLSGPPPYSGGSMMGNGK